MADKTTPERLAKLATAMLEHPAGQEVLSAMLTLMLDNERLTRERDEALARARAAEGRISRAIDYASGRWSEWGERALGVIEILEGDGDD